MPVSVPLTCTDPDGDPMTLSIVDGPSKGSLGAISGGAVTYTPDAGELRRRLVHLRRERRHRGLGARHRAPDDHPPARLRRCRVRTAVGTAVQVPLDCTDPDGDTLTFSKRSDPAKGTLGAITGSTVVYTPNPGEFGPDSFTYGASDGTAASAAATVNVTISRPPACEDVEETVRVGSSVAVPLTCTDPDGDPLDLEIAGGPSQGSLGAISGNSVTYTADADALGEDTFTFTAADGTADSPAATATITLTGPPRCADVSRRTRVETAVAVPLACVDPDGDTLTLSIADAPAKGTLGAISGGSVTYTPDAGEHGTDTFTFTANDGEDDSAPATATIVITRAPSCEDADAKTAVGEPVSVPRSCTDADGDTLTLAKASDPPRARSARSPGRRVTYTPTRASRRGLLHLHGDDGDRRVAAATVSITITRPPVCDAGGRPRDRGPGRHAGLHRLGDGPRRRHDRRVPVHGRRQRGADRGVEDAVAPLRRGRHPHGHRAGEG